MTADPPHPPADGDWFEIAAATVQGLLYPVGLRDRPLKPVPAGRARPIVMVHGWGGNRSCLLPLEGYLRAVGFDRIYPFNMGPAGEIESLAALLADFIERVRNSCGGGETIDLVAHSLGGLVARSYLQERDGARWVDRCLTIATPHYGTYSSFWAPTTVGRQMRPDSAYLARLNDPQHRARGVRFSSLWAGRDLMILPREHAAYREGDAQCLPGVGHMGILLHPEALRWTAERLRAGQDLPAGGWERAAALTRSLWRSARRLARGNPKAQE